MTVAQAWAAFLAQHEASPARLALLEAMGRRAVEAFGDQAVASLAPNEVAAWRASMPPPTRWQATQAFAQVTAWARRWGLIELDPMTNVPNPRPTAREFTPFGSWDQIAVVAAALPPRLRLLPWIGAGCGLRPGELLGLEWSSVDLTRRELVVCRTVWRGELRSELKTRRSRRVVPIRDRVAEQVDTYRPRGATGLVLAAPAGGPADLHNLRARAWRPALAAAGIHHPHRIYDLRHAYATWSLRAGVSIFQLARRMGTSVDMIDATYGHLAADAGAHERALLDTWD
ncbi:MAG: integrase, partial [Thermoleophilia bacterium]|nr:integrase [Thermoleophilia bacterium]